MYMSRVSLNHADANRLAKTAGRDGYRVHQALWRLFEDDANATRDFLYRQESDSGLPVFLVVSRRLPSDRDGFWRIETKEYRPQLATGERLAFAVRVNPVVSRRDDAGRQHRHDVVMDLKRRRQEQSLTQAEMVQQSVWQWFEGRAEKAGFSAKQRDFRADGYRQHELHKRGRGIRFSTAECLGVLTVTDGQRLTETLLSGLGPAKGFGCGLLLVRRL
jgi:CRISPR system Cascade subunit CasE